MWILRGKKKINKKEVKYLKEPSGSLEDSSLKLPWSSQAAAGATLRGGSVAADVR